VVGTTLFTYLSIAPKGNASSMSYEQPG